MLIFTIYKTTTKSVYKWNTLKNLFNSYSRENWFRSESNNFQCGGVLLYYRKLCQSLFDEYCIFVACNNKVSLQKIYKSKSHKCNTCIVKLIPVVVYKYITKQSPSKKIQNLWNYQQQGLRSKTLFNFQHYNNSIFNCIPYNSGRRKTNKNKGLIKDKYSKCFWQ